jgi:hypothetical protein
LLASITMRAIVADSEMTPGALDKVHRVQVEESTQERDVHLLLSLPALEKATA